MDQQKENLILSGSVWKQLVFFATPLLASNILQQLYNAVDSIVVGRYVGEGALAAVGSTTAIIFLMVAFLQGVATGAGVVISRYIGSGELKNVKRGIVNAMIFSIVGGSIIAVIAYFMCPYILTWMRTPGDIFDMTNEYLQIYFISLPLIALYNTGASLMRALGDSKKPLYFLLACSIVNLITDLYFVRSLNMGVVGVAWATLLAQLVSVGLVFLVLFKFNQEFNLTKKDLHLSMPMIKKIVRIGLPVGVQSSAVSFANVLFQSQVNIFGSIAVAGYSASARIQGFIGMPITAFGMAATTFVSQNMGAHNYSRVKEISRACLIMSVGLTITLSALGYAFRYPLLGIFTQDPEVQAYGVLHMIIVLLPSFVWAFPHILGSVITGTGRSVGPMAVTMINMCGVRLLWIFAMLRVWYDIRVVFMGFPVSWITAAIWMVLYYIPVMKVMLNPENHQETIPSSVNT